MIFCDLDIALDSNVSGRPGVEYESLYIRSPINSPTAYITTHHISIHPSVPQNNHRRTTTNNFHYMSAIVKNAGEKLGAGSTTGVQGLRKGTTRKQTDIHPAIIYGNSDGSRVARNRACVVNRVHRMAKDR